MAAYLRIMHVTHIKEAPESNNYIIVIVMNAIDVEGKNEIDVLLKSSRSL
jgi:hypothetical protein